MAAVAMQVPHIPPELIETILGCISHLPTLKSCSLVGRDFVYASQRTLFSEVTLSPPKYRGRSRPTPAQRFLNNLVESPHIAPFVQTLVIACEDSVEDQPWLYNDSALQHILPLLTGLQKISVNGRIQAEDERISGKANLSWSSLSATLRSALASIMRSGSVVDLELGGFSRIPVSSVIQSCSRLKKLSLLPLYLIDDVEREAPPPRDTSLELNSNESSVDNAIRLEDVTIKQSSIALRRTTDWLLHPRCQLDIRDLQKFHFTVSTIEDHRHISKIVDICSASLRHLDLTPGVEVHSIRHLLRVAAPEVQNENAFTLASLGSLQSLKVNTEIRMYKLNNNRFGDPLPWLVSLLSTLPEQNSLSKLEVSIGLHINKQILENVSWADLAKVLRSDRLSHLKSVALTFPLITKGNVGEGRPSWVKEVLQQNTHLSELRRRGLLSINL